MKRDSNLTASDKFVIILAIVSIIGFIEIVSYTLFDFSSGVPGYYLKQARSS
jgi:hypothetical protein